MSITRTHPLARLRNTANPSAKQRWLFATSLALSDFLLAVVIFTLGSRFWLARSLDWPALLGMAGIVVGAQALCLAYVARPPGPAWSAVASRVLGGVVAAAAYWMLRGAFEHAVSRPTFAAFAAVLVVPQVALRMLHRTASGTPGTAALEPLRWLVIAAALLSLHRPLLSTGTVGAGDAYWYTIMVADFVTQWRDGVFPVFAGQSEFAFNGAISPLRFAPALQHFAGLLDLVTAHSLTLHGLLNLTLLTCFAGGAFTCYGSLRAIEPRTPWLALVLGLLYSACPGILALAYVGDLFMSITAVPFVPLLLYGAWRTLAKGDLFGVIVMSAAAAALWYCHPPIALWATGSAALIQLVRLFWEGRYGITWRYWLLGAACFALLAFYSGVSVKSLGIPAYPASRPVLVENLASAFPRLFLPLSETLVSLGDYQLGWALWAVLLAGIAGLACTRPRRPGLAFLAAISVVLAFLIPSPLLKHLWFAVPQAICDITFMWPMQRLYVVLAALGTFLAFMTLGPFSARHRGWGAGLLVVFASAGTWSAFELRKFHAHAALTHNPPAAAQQQLRPQNRILTRYSFNPFRDIPPYFSHGFIDPRIPNRLLAKDTLGEIASNAATLEKPAGFGVVLQQGTLATVRPEAGATILSLEPRFRLGPNRTYALRIDFAHPNFPGALGIKGTHTSRNYWLPHSGFDTKTTGPSIAFGSLPELNHTITLWTDQAAAEDVSLIFYFTGPPPPEAVASLGSFTFREIDLSQLPVFVKEWVPYRATAQTPVAAYLETPRLFLDGYRATVDGLPLPVERSPSALAMIPIPAGTSTVELAYRGPWLLRFAYYLSGTAWIALLAAGGAKAWRARPRHDEQGQR